MVFNWYDKDKGGGSMKRKCFVLALVLVALSSPGFAGAVHLTGDLSADFLGAASAEQIISAFSVGNQPLFAGFGWEVILDRVGFGGDLMVNFFRDTAGSWWLDWYAPALYLSFHPLGANWILDPFIQVGAGCAGQVLLDRTCMPDNPNLSLSLFPFVAAGLALNLDGLLLSAKAAYTPYKAPVPVTSIPAMDLGLLQVSLSAGLSLGW
jgi:hypothetical protein